MRFAKNDEVVEFYTNINTKTNVKTTPDETASTTTIEDPGIGLKRDQLNCDEEMHHEGKGDEGLLEGIGVHVEELMQGRVGEIMTELSRLDFELRDQVIRLEDLKARLMPKA